MKTKLIIIITFILLIISYCIYSVYSFFTYPSTVATYTCNNEKITITRNYQGALKLSGDKNTYSNISTFFNNEKVAVIIREVNYQGQDKVLLDCLVNQTMVLLSNGEDNLDVFPSTVKICYLSNPYNFTDYPNC